MDRIAQEARRRQAVVKLAADWLLQRLVCHYYGLPMPKRQQVTGILTVEIKKPPHFVDLYHDEGYYGYHGLRRLMREMRTALDRTADWEVRG